MTLEILVFETEEEAKQELEQYRTHNQNNLNELENKSEEDSFRDVLEQQKNYFMFNLAYIGDKVYSFCMDGPLRGMGDIYENVPEMARGVQNLANQNGVYNLEVIAYTINEHKESAFLTKEEAKDCYKEVKSEINADEDLGFFAKLYYKIVVKGLFWSFQKPSLTRGLNQQEREEFERLYNEG